MIRIRILGIGDGKDGGACLLEDGEILYTINEERMRRIKVVGGFPRQSIGKILALNGNDINLIAVGGIVSPFILLRSLRWLHRLEDEILTMTRKDLKAFLSDFIKYKVRLPLIKPDTFLGKIQKPIIKKLIRRDLPKSLKNKPLILIDHHLAHASSAYFTSGKKRALCITADGYGDGVSLTVNICEDGEIKRIFENKAYDSFGLFYSLITLLLGFKSHRHEGKVTGLAAYGDPEVVKNSFPFKTKSDKIVYTGKWGGEGLKYFKKLLRSYKKEDIAAWLQKNLEETICTLVEKWVNRTGIKDVILAGGVFANVKLNQKICEIPGVNSVYIFPHMGDGGLPVGASLYVWSRRTKVNPKKLDHVYLGPEYSGKEIREELEKNKLSYKIHKNIELEIARLLSNGKVVARFNGRMEYGPRALGNRSILYQATDPTVNDWLNKKLKRTEFMPFAPSTLIEYASLCYKNFNGGLYTAKFMTITFECTEWMKKNCPGVVHVDGTARPQLVDKKTNPSYYRIVDEYRKITGIPTIINTSFNIHEEPIVNTLEDAIRAFLEAKLDYLTIGNFMVEGQN